MTISPGQLSAGQRLEMELVRALEPICKQLRNMPNVADPPPAVGLEMEGNLDELKPEPIHAYLQGFQNAVEILNPHGRKSENPNAVLTARCRYEARRAGIYSRAVNITLNKLIARLDALEKAFKINTAEKLACT